MIKRFFFVLIFYSLFISSSWSIIEIDITEGNREPLPIAITKFFYNDTEKETLEDISINIRNVISADLERSGLFKSINKEAFIQDNQSMHLRPRFEE